jgi:LPS sulfotransferase NodH
MNVRLLLSTQRSGSHFLKSLIETQFPQVTCSGEALEQPIPHASQTPTLRDHPGFPHFWPWYENEARAGRISVAPDQRYAAFEAYLKTLVEMTSPRNLVVDTKYNSLRSLSGYWDTDYGSNDFVSFVTSRKIPVLHLIRKNILRTVISNRLAQQTGIWHRATERSPEEVLPRLRLNPKGVLFDIRYGSKLTQDYQNRFAGYPGYEEIVYEELVQEQNCLEHGISLRTLALFLDVDPISPLEPSLPFKKTTPEDLSEVVENWQDVVRIVRTTEHGWMTETPLLAAA